MHMCNLMHGMESVDCVCSPCVKTLVFTLPHLHACSEERFDDDVDILEAAHVPLYSSDDEADAVALTNLPVVVPAPRMDPDPPAAVVEAPNNAANGCEHPLVVSFVLHQLGMLERQCVTSLSGHAFREWLVVLALGLRPLMSISLAAPCCTLLGGSDPLHLRAVWHATLVFVNNVSSVVSHPQNCAQRRHAPTAVADAILAVAPALAKGTAVAMEVDGATA
jgi:hypothetical protein